MLLVLLLALVPGLDRYAGTYHVVREDCDAIRPVIERTVSKMSFLIRGIARNRLLKTQIVFPEIIIVNEESEFRIRHLGGTDVGHTSIDAGVKAKAPDGSEIVVRLQPGPPLIQSYESGDGKRENVYTLSPDGSRLFVDVRISSPRLPEMIRYRLVYARAGTVGGSVPSQR